MKKEKIAILYVRVSTDRQADGYSPASQEEKLRHYCEQRGIKIFHIYYEDESAKDFDGRPEWQKIMGIIRNRKNGITDVLFISWDRFSRNIAAAYAEIEKLKQYGVQPQGIEQPLDLTVPEQKIILAMYLVTPEVENDRRSIKVTDGMRRASVEGRWMGSCLTGYKHDRKEINGRLTKIISPEGGKIERLVKMAFELCATGIYPIDELRRKMNKEGLNLSRAQFHRILSHQGYIGKVFVPPYKDEPGYWRQGIHEPLIDEPTFFKVQEVLTGRKRPGPAKNVTFRKELPLRGFLQCPQCGANLTGSASRGSLGGRFYYYHCSKGCKERKKANEANGIFLKVLEDFKMKPGAAELSRRIFDQLMNANHKNNRERSFELKQQIEKLNARLKNARSMRLDGEMDAKEYYEMKEEISGAIRKLEIEQAELAASSVDYSEHVDFLFSLMQNIDLYFENAEGEVKKQIIRSVFPKKLSFDGEKYRTEKLNPAIELLSNENASNKRKKHPYLEVLSHQVVSTGIEPVSKV